jgi:hypothetical protein
MTWYNFQKENRNEFIKKKIEVKERERGGQKFEMGRALSPCCRLAHSPAQLQHQIRKRRLPHHQAAKL